jgi:outer membrane lipase/esterase
MKRSHTRHWIAAAALLLAGSAQAWNGLVVFGDSLSDNGNVAAVLGTDPAQVISGNGYVPSRPYASGTFSNGPVWVDSFAASLGLAAGPALLGGSNYAFGGAQTSDESGGSPSLTTQLGMFMLGHGGVAAADSLYVLAGGGNNARAALQAILGGADVATTVAATAAAYAADLGAMVDTLQAAGAADIVVWNSPDLGQVPAVRAFGDAARALASGLGTAMNAALAARLAGEAGVQTFDLYGFVDGVAADPASHGLLNVVDACGAPSMGCDAATALFWDGIHPSASGHLLLADAMLAQVVPEPAHWALLLAGGLFIAWRRRAR